MTRLITKLDSFAFHYGGLFRISANFDPAENGRDGVVRAYVCTERQYAMLPADTFALEAECLTQTTSRCYASVPLNATSVHTFNISITDRFRFALVYCNGHDAMKNGVTAEVTYEALNPGPSQLPYGDQRLPLIFNALVIAWAMLVCFIGQRIAVAGADRRNMLHMGLFFVLGLKMMVVSLAAWYWSRYQTGHRVEALGYAKRITFAASEAAFFAVLLIVSKGWRITRVHLRSSELKTLLLALALLLLTLVFFSFYSDDYYFLALMIMYFFMLPKIFSGITKNLRSLEGQIWMAENVQLPEVSLRAFRLKLHMFQVLRGSVIAYLASILLINSLRIVIIWYWDWVNVLINEVISVGILATISWVLRPGHDGVFTDLAEVAQLSTLQTLLDRTAAMANPDAPALLPWSHHSTLIIRYPSLNPANNVPETMSKEPASHNICVAVRADYDKTERFEASTHHFSPPSSSSSPSSPP